MDVGNLYEENTKMKTRGMYLCKIFFIKSMFLNLYLFCMGGDLNGGVVEFPVLWVCTELWCTVVLPWCWGSAMVAMRDSSWMEDLNLVTIKHLLPY